MVQVPNDMNSEMSMQMVSQDERGSMAKCQFGKTVWIAHTKKGYGRGGEYHPVRQYMAVVYGQILVKMMINEEEIERRLIDGQSIVIPEDCAHVMFALEDSLVIEWHDGELPPFDQKKIYEPYRKLIWKKRE